MKANQAAFDAGQLAERLAQGYYAHLAAISVAADPRADQLVPQILPGHHVPIGTVKRKDGTEHAFDFKHFLRLARTDAVISCELERVWLAGSLLRLGDILTQNHYFDRAPELELVRHLRNGIAHGNHFRIDDPSKLAKFPAHNRYAWVRSDTKAVFEITASVQGQPVLFDYLGAGDVLDVLMSVGLYLVRMGNGDPLRP
jgi:hypothetical protein